MEYRTDTGPSKNEVLNRATGARHVKALSLGSNLDSNDDASKQLLFAWVGG